MSEQTIELDCPPGNPRPGDLISSIIADTGLPAREPSFMFFGNWTWVYNDIDAQTWSKAQEIVKPRIERLYNMGIIRYGSW